MSNDWNLSQTNLGRLRSHKYEVAVLPIGATEPHNLHLPHGMDWFEADLIAQRCCKAAFQRTGAVLCLPALPYGVDCNMLSYPMAIHVSQATLDAMVREIIASLRRHGIRKIVLLNAHGGNDFAPLVRQVQCDMDVFVFACNWWEVAPDMEAQIFAAKDDHAGERETSMALAWFPQHVDMDKAGDGHARPFAFDALQKRWVRTSRDFAKLNDCCGVGDPRLATADKGGRYLDVICQRLTEFLVELAQSPIDAKFPHK